MLQLLIMLHVTLQSFRICHKEYSFKSVRIRLPRRLGYPVSGGIHVICSRFVETAAS